MFPGVPVLGAQPAGEDSAAYHFGEFLGGLFCLGGVIAVVVFVKWALNPPRRRPRDGDRSRGREPDEDGLR